ncbi:hypothetical protein H4582DRAFT_2059022 [Lactarius indigo]|nr:hypothetical protein H4582DRAFT_2062791 [Lactarius indigo]KAI9435917.1 hypothetical protein H4582DRAFT_2059022 [Lactarius indigo]
MFVNEPRLSGTIWSAFRTQVSLKAPARVEHGYLRGVGDRHEQESFVRAISHSQSNGFIASEVTSGKSSGSRLANLQLHDPLAEMTGGNWMYEPLWYTVQHDGIRTTLGRGWLNR